MFHLSTWHKGLCTHHWGSSHAASSHYKTPASMLLVHHLDNRLPAHAVCPSGVAKKRICLPTILALLVSRLYRWQILMNPTSVASAAGLTHYQTEIDHTLPALCSPRRGTSVGIPSPSIPCTVAQCQQCSKQVWIWWGELLSCLQIGRNSTPVPCLWPTGTLLPSGWPAWPVA